MINILNNISIWSIPIIFAIILLYGILHNVNIYDVFTEGAAEGLTTVAKIFPYLLAMMVAINIFKESGFLNIIINILSPITDFLQIPANILPLVFLRPLSGSGALSYTSQIIKEYGPDSYPGLLASTIQGSTETTFYIIAVYFGAIGIKKYRYAITVGLLADLAGFLAAVFICKLLFL